MTPTIFEHIEPLAERYDAFILDLWGVVHDGRKPYPGAVECLARLRQAGKPVAFLTNAPRRGWFINRFLEEMGVGRDLYAGTMSSGEATWLLLQGKFLKEGGLPWSGRRAFFLGTERDLSVIEDGAAELVDDPRDADFLLNTGPDPRAVPTSVDPYLPTLRACFEAGLPMLCVNPDRAVMVGGNRVLCAGAFSDVYQGWGGAVVEVGKPDPAVYAPTLALLGHPDRARVLCVGDTPHTDLAGAQAAGMDSLWALTGLTADAHGDDPDPRALARVAEREGVAPVGLLRTLRW